MKIDWQQGKFSTRTLHLIVKLTQPMLFFQTDMICSIFVEDITATVEGRLAILMNLDLNKARGHKGVRARLMIEYGYHSQD